MLIAATLFIGNVFGQQKLGMEEYTLDNGLTVILNEDPNAAEVFGCIMTKAGSKDDPDGATGMAHYMEHMLFKGTSEMGTVDYEKEKPHIDNIFSLYDELGKTKEDTARAKIQKKINEESLKAAEFAIPNEMSNIINSMGGTNMNAGTGPDYTIYYNAFPPHQMEKFLELYSHRFIEPVFRSFQAELEVVYEEKNMYTDMFIMNVINEFNKQFFKNHPYGQKDRIGTIDELKNPSLTKMYDFFTTYYVANNMALVLSGNFKAEDVKPIIEEKFGRLKRGTIPERKVYEEKPFSGREYFEANLSPIKMALLGFRTVPETHDDYLALEIANRILSNSNQTGLLDELSTEGELLAAQVMPMPFNDHGATIMLVIPKIIGQKMEDAEALVMTQVKKLREGDFDDKMIDAIKNELYMDHQLSLESTESKAVKIATYFAQYRDIEEINAYPKKIKNITKEQIVEVAKKYYGDDYLAFYSKMGFKKAEKIDKPEYKPLVANTNAKSPFRKMFDEIPEGKISPNYVDFKNDVDYKKLKEGVEIYAVANPVNDIFDISIVYALGSFEVPELEYAAMIMNYSGADGLKVTDYKKKFSELGCRYSISCNDNYLKLDLQGLDENFTAAMKTLNQLLTKPELDPKKIDLIVEAVSSERKMERSEPDNIAGALFQYVKYKEQSSYLRRLSSAEIKKLNTDTLVARFQHGLKYPVEIHYSGSKNMDGVIEVVSNTIPMDAKLKSKTPIILEPEKYKENTVFFCNKKNAVQSKIFLFANGKPYSIEDDAVIEAFNMYFGGGFSGLVLQEIREYRSLAYTAAARMSTPGMQDYTYNFMGYVGTQADKTMEALEVFYGLLTDMPKKPERMDMINKYMAQSAVTSRPDFRSLSKSVSNWKEIGYPKDPSEYNMEAYKTLTFDDLYKFYEENLKGKPIVFAFVGDAKRIDMKEVEKYGKIIKVKEKALFK
jgi:predicted Zn-dependent peptidase